MSGVSIGKKSQRGALRGARRWALAGLALASASCVPVSVSRAPFPIAPMPSQALPTADMARSPTAPDATPNAPAAEAGPGARGYLGRTALDRLRSLDCLAQAIYYEAASESENGQRAVAQVVLNRVRHPAWPNSVCGVVYQGPMRPGGGCQFTFTCDGSLAVRPSGIAWTRARILAAQALGGRRFAPVGLSTHYHSSAVFPSWAPRLDRTTTIGAHNFYRLPGTRGEAPAFTALYAGTEPMPRPAMTLIRQPAAPAVAPGHTAVPFQSAVPLPSGIRPDPGRTPANLPESTVRDAYRNSGQWRADAPVAVTGR